MEESLFIRQQDLISQEKLQNTPITIIGAGAVGSFTALALAKMGARNIRVFDADRISKHNFPNQFYPYQGHKKGEPEFYVGWPKVVVLKSIVEVMTGVQIEEKIEFYDDQFLDGIVITAVDNMAAREKVSDKICDNRPFLHKKESNVELLVDPRMGGQVFRIFLIHPKNNIEAAFYSKTLYSDEKAQSDPCTAAAIIYNVLGISSHICNFIKKHINNEPLRMTEFVFDYQNLDMLKITGDSSQSFSSHKSLGCN